MRVNFFNVCYIEGDFDKFKVEITLLDVNGLTVNGKLILLRIHYQGRRTNVKGRSFDCKSAS
jgi:hypothetical protein